MESNSRVSIVTAKLNSSDTPPSLTRHFQEEIDHLSKSLSQQCSIGLTTLAYDPQSGSLTVAIVATPFPTTRSVGTEAYAAH